MLEARPSPDRKPPKPALGPPPVVYVKPVTKAGEVCYAIYGGAGDGRPLALAPTRALAMAFARARLLLPVDAH